MKIFFLILKSGLNDLLHCYPIWAVLQGLSSLISLLRRANERKAELFSLFPQRSPRLSAQEASRSQSQKEEPLQLWGARQSGEEWGRLGEEKTLALAAEDALAGKKYAPWPQLGWRWDGWSDGAAWARKKGADMKIAGKAACIFVLLTITKLTRITGESNCSLGLLSCQGGRKGNVHRSFLPIRAMCHVMTFLLVKNYGAQSKHASQISAPAFLFSVVPRLPVIIPVTSIQAII